MGVLARKAHHKYEAIDFNCGKFLLIKFLKFICVVCFSHTVRVADLNVNITSRGRFMFTYFRYMYLREYSNDNYNIPFSFICPICLLFTINIFE